ncbi:MAG: hypothetical protein RLZ84_607 [Actinomycetota bacterium]
MRAVSIESLTCVQGSGVSDVTTLCVEDDRDVGVVRANVLADRFKLSFGTDRCEVGDLWFERTHHVCSCIDDVDTEACDGRPVVLQGRGEPCRIGVKTDTQQ